LFLINDSEGAELDFSKRITLLTVLFFCLAAANFFLISSEKYEYSGTKIISNFHIDGWQDIDIPSDDKVIQALEADSTVFKRYQNIDGETISLYIGHYKKLEKAKFSHSPKVCFTAQGWIMSNAKHISLLLDGHKLNCVSMIVDKGTKKELVYYWYQFDNKTFADLYKMKFALLSKKISGGNEDNLFVRVTTPVATDVEAASIIISKFLEDLYPAINNAFFVEK
jgi:EpsI family protein